MEPIAYMITESLAIGDEEPRPTAVLELYEYGMVYKRLNFGIRYNEEGVGEQEWLLDRSLAHAWSIELVMN
jgi:hypothetical protein